MEAAIINAAMDREREADRQVSVELVERAVRGDRGAFERLVEPHLLVALGAARLITGDEADAADAVQDALLTAWQQLDSLRDPQLFPAWFRRIVIRSATKAVRGRRRLVELDLETPGPIDSLDREFDRRQLRSA